MTCVLFVALLASASPAAGPAPVRLTPEARDRFAAALQSHRAADWATAAREFADLARSAAPIADYALLYHADSLARLGDAANARLLAQQIPDQWPDSRAVSAALILAAEQASRAGDEAGAAALWRRVLDRFPDLPDLPRARLAWAQALSNAGRLGEAAAAYRELWLLLPASPQGEAAARELRALEGRGVALAALTPVQRVERAERLVAAGTAEAARSEAELLLAEKPSTDVALRALHVVMDASRRLNRDDAALLAVNRALALAPADKRAPWILDSAKIQQKKNREGAIVQLDRLVAAEPKSAEAPEALLLKARLLGAGSAPKSAEPVYVKLTQSYPESDEGLAATWRLGWLSWLRGDYGEAIEPGIPRRFCILDRPRPRGARPDRGRDPAVRSAHRGGAAQLLRDPCLPPGAARPAEPWSQSRLRPARGIAARGPSRAAPGRGAVGPRRGAAGGGTRRLRRRRDGFHGATGGR